MLSHFFKKEVVFSFQSNHDWTIVQFYTPMPKWQEALKDALGVMCSDNLFFDDYVLGSSETIVQEINIHADITDIMMQFLTERHGFSQGHPVKDQNVLNHLTGESFFKKLTEKQYYAFLKDLEKLQLTPSTELKHVLEHVKRFDQF